MIVMKFGGTSLADANQIKTVFDLVQTEMDKARVVVVVSAHSGITNRLIQAAEDQEGKSMSLCREIADKHRKIIKNLDLDARLVDEELTELREVLRGIQLVRELTLRTRDYVMSFGERMSSKIVAAYFSSQGLAARALNAYDTGFITDSHFGSATLLEGQNAEIKEKVMAIHEVPVITGFIAKNRQGDITTLGRSGSDTSAAIIGGAIGANEIQIWTDVDGIMTADPSLLQSAQSIPCMSFDEAAELAYFGARVLHPNCLRPAMANNIPVRVLNTYRPDHPGTVITPAMDEQAPSVRAIAYKEDQILLNIVSTRMFLNYGFMAKVFEIFGRYRVAIDLIATTEVSVSMTVSSMESMEEIVHELNFFSEVTVKKNKAIVCVVGSLIRRAVGVAGDVFSTLRDSHVPVDMISVGASKINISFVVDNADIGKAVTVLHKIFFETR